jgi:hypothetical protein
MVSIFDILCLPVSIKYDFCLIGRVEIAIGPMFYSLTYCVFKPIIRLYYYSLSGQQLPQKLYIGVLRMSVITAVFFRPLNHLPVINPCSFHVFYAFSRAGINVCNGYLSWRV